MISTLKKLQAKKTAQENSGGFTLIELLIVIVVLGILAAVVVFSLGGVTASSVTSACQADGATVETAIASYNAQVVGVPVTAALLVPKYLVSFPNSTHYVYAISTVTGTLWEAKGATSTAGLTTDATFAAAKPAGTWNKWVGSSTCSIVGTTN
jgi:prepilin-type N-terminal cleavage/methylation domain-containing protein